MLSDQLIEMGKKSNPKSNLSQNEAAGLKKFVIEGREIWALNEKNAIRKFNKQKP